MYKQQTGALQWGRDLSVAEGTAPPRPTASRPAASMGPRPFGRGRTTPRSGRTSSRGGFNGAATFRSRKVINALDMLVRTAGASMGPRPFGRGRLLLAFQRFSRLMSRASMGPRPFGRGRRRHVLQAQNPRVPLQWGRDLSVAEGWRAASCCSPWPRRFNGAATFRSRKEPNNRLYQAAGSLLQWGRDLSVAEGSGAHTKRPAGRPLQWGRDLSVAEGRRRPQPVDAKRRASMGPRPFGRGRKVEYHRHRRNQGASMGPRPFGRGRHVRAAADLARRLLQWGRDLSVAEGSRGSPAISSANLGFNGAATFRSRKGGSRRPTYLTSAASMGPRPFGRGRHIGDFCALADYNASMGPRPFGRGRVGPAAGGRRAVKLQWGRDLSVAEGGSAREKAADACASMGPRPFGRGRRRRATLERAASWCFNGAATFRSRKARGTYDQGRHDFASMGPRPFGRGRRPASGQGAARRRASMGPRPFGRGRPGGGAGQPAPFPGFNGAATFRSRKAQIGNV